MILGRLEKKCLEKGCPEGALLVSDGDDVASMGTARFRGAYNGHAEGLADKTPGRGTREHRVDRSVSDTLKSARNPGRARSIRPKDHVDMSSLRLRYKPMRGALTKTSAKADEGRDRTCSAGSRKRARVAESPNLGGGKRPREERPRLLREIPRVRVNASI